MQGLRAVLWPSGCGWEPRWDGFVWSYGVTGCQYGYRSLRITRGQKKNNLFDFTLTLSHCSHSLSHLSCTVCCVCVGWWHFVLPALRPPSHSPHPSVLGSAVEASVLASCSAVSPSGNLRVRRDTHSYVQVSNKE